MVMECKLIITKRNSHFFKMNLTVAIVLSSGGRSVHNFIKCNVISIRRTCWDLSCQQSRLLCEINLGDLRIALEV